MIQERYPSPDQTNHRDSLLTLTVSNRDLPVKPFPASFCSPGKICITCEVMTSSGTQEKNVDGGEASSASSKNKGMGKRRCNVLAVRCAHLPNKHTFYAGLSVRYEPSCSEATGLGWGDTMPFTHWPGQFGCHSLKGYQLQHSSSSPVSLGGAPAPSSSCFLEPKPMPLNRKFLFVLRVVATSCGAASFEHSQDSVPG